MICRLCRGTGFLLADDATDSGEPCPDCWAIEDNGDEVFILVGAINGPPVGDQQGGNACHWS